MCFETLNDADRFVVHLGTPHEAIEQLLHALEKQLSNK